MTFTLTLKESSEGTGRGRAAGIHGRCFKSTSRHILKRRTTSSCHLSLDRACYRYKQNMTKTLIQREQKVKNKQLVAEEKSQIHEMLKHILKPDQTRQGTQDIIRLYKQILRRRSSWIERDQDLHQVLRLLYLWSSENNGSNKTVG